ncbi:MAG: phosphoglycerate dehydrogenase [Dehalococcoidia bacterium]
MRRRILITCPQLQETIEPYRPIFERHDIDIELPTVAQQLTEAELLDIIDRFDGVIAGDDEFTAPVLEKAKRLKTIARWGVGIDGIDLKAAEKFGISVSNTPNVFNDEVADVVIGYMVMLSRQLHQLDRGIRAGNWPKIQGISLRDKVLGIIGVGSIGRALAQRGIALGMRVLGYDVNPISDSVAQAGGFQMVELDQLLQDSDFISLNCNLTAANRHMLGPQQFALMKPGVYLINAARGPLIDESALCQALGEGKVAGAALDVFEKEPLPGESPLRQFDTCIFGTHNSSNTREAVLRVNQRAIDNLLKELEKAGPIEPGYPG